MSHSLNKMQTALLQECFSMAKDPTLHAEAAHKFLDLAAIATTPEATIELLEALWKEVLAARRSEAFWQRISDAERTMTDRLTNDHVQLQQNYLRLMQEQ